MGQAEEPILIGAYRKGADRVILLATREVPGESYPVARKVKTELEQRGISAEIREIDLLDFFSNVRGIIKLIRQIKHEIGYEKHPATTPIYVNITGGTKPMSCAALVAALNEGVLPYYVQEKPKPERIIDLPLLPLALSYWKLSKVESAILGELHARDSKSGFQEDVRRCIEGKISMRPPAKSTVSIACKKLEQLGLLATGLVIHSKTRRPSKLLRLTDMGSLYAWYLTEFGKIRTQ